MKAIYAAILTVGFLLGITVSAVGKQQDTSQRQGAAEFKITLTVNRSENSVSMKCAEGCAWRTLSFGCKPDGPECGSFDERGTPAH